jgi:hypothetical protein
MKLEGEHITLLSSVSFKPSSVILRREAKRRKIPEDNILHSDSRENLKSQRCEFISPERN